MPPRLLSIFDGAPSDVASSLLGCGLPLARQRCVAEAWLKRIDAAGPAVAQLAD